ncbi:MAG: hypothetical protein RL701_3467 [Pseudomonadota bacterium]
MQDLTDQGNQAVQNLAQRYGVSTDAVRTLLLAVNAGGGTMAQFYHSELGGGGQWMQGGMTMVGDMFNHGLKATVSNLCQELSNLLASSQVFAPVTGGFQSFSNNGNWWPSDLGSPSSSGGQNDSRYAYFPNARRLAVQSNGQTRVYDTLDHNIGGVQQQQGGAYGSQSFSSQRGTFTVDSLPLVSGGSPAADSGSNYAPNNGNNQSYGNQNFVPDAGPKDQSSIFAAIDKLGDLHHRGILSDDEFRTKKAELLSRL